MLCVTNRPGSLASWALMPPNGQQINNNNSSTYNSSTTKAGANWRKLVITDHNKVKATSRCIQIRNKLKRTSWHWSTVRRSACTYRVTLTQSLTRHYDLSLHRKFNINSLHYDMPWCPREWCCCIDHHRRGSLPSEQALMAACGYC